MNDKQRHLYCSGMFSDLLTKGSGAHC